MAAFSSRTTASGHAAEPTLRALILGLSLAAAIELLVLRTFTRTAIHIPALEQLSTPYEWLTLGGRYAYYVAVVLLMFALVSVTVAMWNTGNPALRAAAIGTGAFMAAAAMARAEMSSTLLADFLTVAALASVAASSAATLRMRPALSIMLFTAAFLLFATHGLVQTSGSDSVRVADTRNLLYAGEVVALLFALSAPLAFGVMPGKRATAAGALVGLVVFAVLMRGESTAKVLLLWNEGLAGSFPSAAYALAATTLFLACAGLAAAGRKMAAFGFALLVIGGFGLHSTYQSGLVVVGMATLALFPGSDDREAPGGNGADHSA